MKRIFILFALVFIFIILLLNIYVSAKDFPNEPDGFRGIKWETHVSKVKNLENKDALYSHGDLTYNRKYDKLELAGAIVENIRYIFTKGKFTGASIQFNNYDNYNLIKEWCFKEYGNPNHFTNTNQMVEEYMWKGKKTLIRLFYNKFNGYGSIEFFPKKYTSF